MPCSEGKAKKKKKKRAGNYAFRFSQLTSVNAPSMNNKEYGEKGEFINKMCRGPKIGGGPYKCASKGSLSNSLSVQLQRFSNVVPLSFETELPDFTKLHQSSALLVRPFFSPPILHFSPFFLSGFPHRFQLPCCSLPHTHTNKIPFGCPRINDKAEIRPRFTYLSHQQFLFFCLFFACPQTRTSGE